MHRCPSHAELEGLARDALEHPRARQVREHLERCGTCGEAFDSAFPEGELAGELRRVALPLAGAPSPPRAGDAFARYTIVRRIGAGGMGIVYEARQERPDRRVALKVLQPHAATRAGLRRFELEAEALGRLDHPCIARVYEAGTFRSPDGDEPYLAMELVEGLEPLAHARERGLDLRARLELFQRICEGVAHAHRRGVLHRDLKPSNLLVDGEGLPRVLDFGVARLLYDEGQRGATRAGQLVGTLAYMSPEQLQGDPLAVDTRSDVFSLGVVLYELLAGEPPWSLAGCSLGEAVTLLSAAQAPRLDRRDPPLPADLALIVATAMAKDVERRYVSVEALAADLRRFLADLPIDARPATLAYRLRKALHRHRRAALVACVAAVPIAAGLGVGLRQSSRAAAAEERAQREMEAAASLGAFLDEILSAADPFTRGDGPERKVRDVLDEASRELERQDALSLPSRLRVGATLGRAYLNLGQLEQAETHLERCLALARAELAPERPERTSAELDRVLLALARGRLDQAQEGLAALEPVVEGEQRLRFHDLRARLFRKRYRFEAARAELARCFELVEAGGAPEEERGTLLLFQAELEGEADEHARSLALARRAVEALERSHGASHPRTAIARHREAVALTGLGRTEEAQPVFERASADLEATLGEPDSFLAAVRRDQARLALLRADPTRADELYRRALLALPAGPRHDRLRACWEVERALLAGGEAEALTRDADRLLGFLGDGGTFDGDHPLVRLARALGDQGRHDLAEALYRRALERADPADEEGTLTLHHNLAVALFRQERWEQAERIQRETLATRRRLFGDESNRVAGAAINLAVTLLRRGAAAEAEELVRGALGVCERLLGPEHARTARARRHRAEALCSLGRPREALEELERALPVVRRHDRPSRGEILGDTLLVRGECLLAIGEREQARAVLREARSRLEDSARPDRVLQRRVAAALEACD